MLAVVLLAAGLPATCPAAADDLAGRVASLTDSLGQLDVPADPRARFARANGYYQEGDFARAAHLYASVLAGGQASPDLYLNLGNALLRAGELGEAIVAYERGRRLAPRDPDLEANLRFARSRSVDVVPESGTSAFLERLAGLVRAISAREALLAAALLYWSGIFIVLVARLVPRWRGLALRALWIWIPVLGLATALAAERAHAVWGRSMAVVVAPTVPVRTGPGAEDTARFTLHEGTRVELRREAAGWIEIRLTDELFGWVPAGTVLEI
ncbi:MAG: tetratricopeptide repeat protein [Candidatus Eiseniibacteriota bacterium]|jgi:tetratricopeptide (TPR) repeat protein